MGYNWGHCYDLWSIVKNPLDISDRRVIWGVMDPGSPLEYRTTEIKHPKHLWILIGECVIPIHLCVIRKNSQSIEGEKT